MIINNKKSHILFLETLKLLPGNNEIPAGAWDQVKDNPLVQQALKGFRGKPAEIEIIAIGKEPDGSLSEVDPRMAKKIVGNTYDVKLLRSWLELEERAAVVRALEAQIDLISVDQGKSANGV